MRYKSSETICFNNCHNIAECGWQGKNGAGKLESQASPTCEANMKPLSKADSTILIACAFALFMALPVHAGDRGYRPFSMGSPTPPPYSIYPSTPPTYAPQPPAIVYSPTPAYLQPPPAVVIVPAPVIEYGPVPYPEYGRHHRLEQRHDGGHRHYPGDR